MACLRYLSANMNALFAKGTYKRVGHYSDCESDGSPMKRT